MRGNFAKVGGERVPRQFGYGTGQLSARRPRTDYDEGQERFATLRIALHLRPLEGRQDAASQMMGVVDRFQSGRVCGPVVLAEIAVLCASREDQIVVVERAAGFGYHLLRLFIDALDFVHEHGDIAVIAQDMANGCGDLSRRQCRGGHLVEQGLEQVIVATIDERDIDSLTGECFGSTQAAEAGTNDHHLWTSFFGHGVAPARTSMRSGPFDESENVRRRSSRHRRATQRRLSRRHRPSLETVRYQRAARR